MQTIPSELHEQKKFKTWLRQRGYRVAASLNGTYTPDVSQRNKMMALGSNRGFPDLCVIIPPFTVFVEMKRQKRILKSGKTGSSPSSVSQEQTEWIFALNELPYARASICYGFEEAKNFITQIEHEIRTKNLWQEIPEEKSDKERSDSFAEFLQPNEREKELAREIRERGDAYNKFKNEAQKDLVFIQNDCKHSRARIIDTSGRRFCNDCGITYY